ncbi:unnamed protein product [Schistocephalus solidus]|uniref:Uncharacterized protein n=1 Tax=Schistocephalus solidus TaxID=70667 RepID=A0A183SMJ1_SCHSO|nr:unnamed protein product [Schistocephalus solidus]
MQSVPRLVDDEPVICPAVGARIAMITTTSCQSGLPQLQAPQSEIHARSFLPRLKVEEGIGQEKMVFCRALVSHPPADPVQGIELW